MKKKMKKLVKKADFCLWGNEPYKPKGAVIDWACMYDKEFQDYTDLLIAECVKAAASAGANTEVIKAINGVLDD
jgi:hypothetical protein